MKEFEIAVKEYKNSCNTLIVKYNNKIILEKQYAEANDIFLWFSGGVKVHNLSCREGIALIDKVIDAIYSSNIFLGSSSWEEGIEYQKWHLLKKIIVKEFKIPADLIVVGSDELLISGQIQAKHISTQLQNKLNEDYVFHVDDGFGEDEIKHHNFNISHPMNGSIDVNINLINEFKDFVKLYKYKDYNHYLYIKIDIPYDVIIKKLINNK